MFTSTDVELVRHVVQRILVPCVVVIGLLGNSVSIYVLTRKRMRCTTNIYLTALAITDIAYLTLAFLLSLKHYEYIKHNSETYYACFGTMLWLADACAYISIYIAVCFTIERFIAIRYPLKRQTFCTESLAKRVMAGVSLFCLLTTISTAFEHEYRIDTKMIDSHGKPCNLGQAATNAQTAQTTKLTAATLETLQRTPLQQDYAVKTWQRPELSDELKDSHMQKATKTERDTIDAATAAASEVEDAEVAVINPLTVKRNATGIPEQQAITASSNIPSMLSALYSPDSLDALLNMEFSHNGFLVNNDSSSSNLENVVDYFNATTVQNHDDVLDNVCRNITEYENVPSDLGKNMLYKAVYFHLTFVIFFVIPLCVLGTFNCVLIKLVRNSKNVRCDLTNANSIRKSTKRKTTSSTVSQENRVTITLIAVVILFIICQLPWAIYLIVSEHMEIDHNLQTIFGNIFNFLAAINAAANFFLYCVLSDKYRKTVRELITGYRYRKQRFNNNNYNNASLYTATSNGNNASRRHRPPRTTSTNASTMSTSSSLVIK